MQERRKFIRYDIEASMALKMDDDPHRIIKGDLTNIGFRGMSAQLTERIPEGIIVSFELTTKLYDKSIIGKGKIMYIKEVKWHDVNIFRIGIEFVHIDNDAIKYIIARLQENICAEARKKGQSKRYSF